MSSQKWTKATRPGSCMRKILRRTGNEEFPSGLCIWTCFEDKNKLNLSIGRVTLNAQIMARQSLKLKSLKRSKCISWESLNYYQRHSFAITLRRGVVRFFFGKIHRVETNPLHKGSCRLIFGGDVLGHVTSSAYHGTLISYPCHVI